MSEEAELSDYVRVKRRNTTIFLYVLMSDTARDVRAKISAVNKVSPTDMRLFLDKNGDIPLDEKKSLADQKAHMPPARLPPAPPPRERPRSQPPLAGPEPAAPRCESRCALARLRWRTTRSYSWFSEKKVRACAPGELPPSLYFG